MQTDACTALDWVAGLFFQSSRLLGLIMQAIATVIGADLGGFADEFGACFEESLFTFFHDVPPVFDWVNGLRGYLWIDKTAGKEFRPPASRENGSKQLLLQSAWAFRPGNERLRERTEMETA